MGLFAFAGDSIIFGCFGFVPGRVEGGVFGRFDRVLNPLLKGFQNDERVARSCDAIPAREGKKFLLARVSLVRQIVHATGGPKGG